MTPTYEMTATYETGAEAPQPRPMRPIPWAERFAQRRRQTRERAPADGMPPEDWIPGAMAALWTLFDEAVTQATHALEQAGLTDRILTRRTSREYWLSMAGPDGARRSISIFVSLRAVQGHASGGAQITTSETRAAMHLVPSIDGGRLRWLVPAAGGEFTTRVVDDLILSVFADDPAASGRLTAYFSLEDSPS